MSYDFELQTPNETSLSGTSRNYTSNVGAILTKALEMNIHDCNGKKGCELNSIFLKAISNILNNRNEYKKLEPENGWGSVDGVLELLVFYQGWFYEEPDMIFTISC